MKNGLFSRGFKLGAGLTAGYYAIEFVTDLINEIIEYRHNKK